MNLMDLESLALRVRRNENLPVLPQVAGTVLKLADDPRVGARELERAIERDIALATKILKVANSSYYGTSSVSSIARAVSILGINAVRSLVVSLAYQQMISGRTSSQRFKKTEFWAHSLGVGITARVIAKMVMPQKAEEMYLAGLMHDVGMLILDRFEPAAFDAALKKATDEKRPLHECELEVLGYNHAMVGSIIASSWGLSDNLIQAIRHHHDANPDEGCAQICATIALANGVAHASGLSSQPMIIPTPICPKALEVLGITEEQLNVIGVVMAQEVMKAQQAFSIQMAA